MVIYPVALGPEFDLLPDDTEQALSGTTLHQQSIVTLVNGLGYLIARRALPWLIGNQLRLLIPRGDGRTYYQPSPDVLVHATLGADYQAGSLNVAEVGAPALVFEITSPLTARDREIAALQAELRRLRRTDN